jgi:dihydrorhizobitoxine desaturase
VNSQFALDGKQYARYRFDKSIRDAITAMKSDNWHGLLALFEDYIIIAISIAGCYFVSWYLYPIAVLVIGARQRGLSTILHDSAHGVLAKNRSLNMFLGTLFTAYPIFQQHFAYKASHVETHHPHLGNPSKDPDLQFFIKQRAYRQMSPARCWIEMMILPALGLRTFAYLKYLIDNRLKNIRKYNISQRTVRTQLSHRLDHYAFLAFWSIVGCAGWYWGLLDEVFLFWVVPYLTSFQILGWYIELSEHTPLMEIEEIDIYMSRNRNSRGLEKFLTGIHNDHYHLDHHLDTRTPFWLLPAAHKVRCQDPVYKEVSDCTGGLFVRGENGAPSAMSAVFDRMTGRVSDSRSPSIDPALLRRIRSQSTSVETGRIYETP